MADPTTVQCPADAWTKVATNVTEGQIWIKNTSPGVYKHTYRLTGNPAPANDDDAIPFYGPMIPISSSAAIDVYIKPTNRIGEVRVDL